MRRRAVLGGGMGALAVAVGGWRPAMASPPGVGIEEPVLFPEGKPVPTVEQILASLPRFQGGHPAYAKEIEKGRRIMEGCARDVAPMAVAQYFATLCGGALNEEYGDRCASVCAGMAGARQSRDRGFFQCHEHQGAEWGRDALVRGIRELVPVAQRGRGRHQ